jgi:hypothetical protein
MSKLRYSEVKEQEMLALVSLTQEEFEILLPHFERTFQEYMSQWCIDGKPRGKRSYTTYKNCPLPKSEDRLLFVLSYMKSNPVQSNHGTLFGMAQCKVNTWLHILLPLLRRTLRELGVAPSRSVEELAERLELTLALEGGMESDSEADLPLFVMTAPNDGLSAPRMRLNRVHAIAARNMRTL